MKNPVSALQETLVAQSAAIGRLQAELAEMSDRVSQLEAVNEQLRSALRASVDDLGARVGALSLRLEETGR